MGLVQLDGTEWRVDGGGTFAAVFEQTRDRLTTADRLIVGVLADGLSLTWGDGADKWREAFAPHSVLRLSTCAPTELATNILQRLHDGLGAVADGHRETANHLRTQITEQRLQEMLDLLGFWRNLEEAVGAVRSLQSLRPNSAADLPLTQQLEAASQRGLEQLTEVQSALRAEDFVLVADLLEFELAPLIDHWRELVPAMRQQWLEPTS